jgi:hypothetical protein
VTPSTSFHDNGDGTAWVLYAPGVDRMFRWKQADRPCDTCGGTRVIRHRYRPDSDEGFCPACFNGRHAFTIEVECPWIDENGPDTRTLTVAVRPGGIEQQEDGAWRVLLDIKPSTCYRILPTTEMIDWFEDPSTC